MDLYDNIPESLKSIPQWLLWTKSKKVDPTTGKFKKYPRGINFKFGMSNFELSTFEEAFSHYKKHPNEYSGLGFHCSNGIVGVDIDNCIEDGWMTEIAKDIVDTLDTYTEKSPSGTGLRLFVKSDCPPLEKIYDNEIGLEIFSQSNFFMTVTGDVQHLEDVNERTEQLQQIIHRYLGHKKKDVETKNYKTTGTIFEGEGRDNNLTSVVGKYIQTGTTEFDDLFSMAKAHTDRRHSPPLSTRDVERIVKSVMKKYFKDKQSQEEAKQPVRPIISNALKFSLDDIGNGERLLHHEGQNIRYCPTIGKWLVWKYNKWAVDDVGAIYELARQTAKKIFLEAYEEQDSDMIKRIAKHGSKSCNNSAIKNMIEQASTMDGIPILQSELDANDFIVNCTTGIINLESGECLPSDRSYLITKEMPVAYDRRATSVLWEEFLERIFDGNKEMIRFIQKSVGYSLTGSNREQCIFICHGTGANGKSTFMDTVIEMMGDYAKNATMTTFLEKKNDSNTNDLARLAGCRFVGASEAEEGKKLSEALIKQLTGGEKISARFLHKEFFEFAPTFKLWMGTNHKPVIKGTDNGIWRRIMLIPFEVTIPEQERDKELPKKLKKEHSGILNWAIEGALLWQKEGLNPPLAVQAANNEYRSEMDVLRNFLNMCVVKCEKATLQSSTLYKTYTKWAEENGEFILSSTKFGLKVKEKGIDGSRSKAFAYWKNIALSDEGKRILGGGQQSCYSASVVDDSDNPFL